MGLGRQAVLDRPEPTDHHAGQQHHDHGRNRVDERQYEGRDARAGVSLHLVTDATTARGAIRAQYTRRWAFMPPECQVIRRFWGRLYFNMSLFQQAAYTLYGTTPDKQIMQLGGAAVQVFTPPGSPSRWQRLRWLGNALRFGRLADRVRQAAPASFAAVEQHWRELLSQIPHLDRAGLLLQLDTFSSVTQSFLLQHLYLTTAMSGNFSHLRDLLARLEASTSSGLVAELMTGLGDVSSAEQSYRLWELSRLALQVTPGDGISPHQTVAHLAGGAGRYTVPGRLAGVPGHLRASLSLRSGDGQPALA